MDQNINKVYQPFEQCQKELERAEKQAEYWKAEYGEDDDDYKEEMEKIKNAQK